MDDCRRGHSVTDFTAERNCWVVVGNPAVPNICFVNAQQHFTSNQSITEVYNDKDLALSRLRQLNPDWAEDDGSPQTFTKPSPSD